MCCFHGDFSVLLLLPCPLQVKSEGSSQSYKWCRRRGLEQQRLYEIVKLRQQFQEILQEAGLLPKGYDSRKWDYQSEEMRRELKQLRKQQRVDQRRRKVLKMDDEGVRSVQEKPALCGWVSGTILGPQLSSHIATTSFVFHKEVSLGLLLYTSLGLCVAGTVSSVLIRGVSPI